MVNFAFSVCNCVPSELQTTVLCMVCVRVCMHVCVCDCVCACMRESTHYIIMIIILLCLSICMIEGYSFIQSSVCTCKFWVSIILYQILL